MFEDLAELDPTALVGVIDSTHRQESAVVARRMAAVATLLGHRIATAAECVEQAFAVIDPYVQTAAEVAAAMNLSALAAGFVVSDAESLDSRLPKVGALLAEGRIDWPTVRLIIRRTELVTEENLVAALDESLAARIGGWSGWSRQRVINAVDAAVSALDPDAIRQRRQAGEKERKVAIRPLEGGMAEVAGMVGAVAGTALDRRLSALATAVCAEDPRTLDQRRADALGALALAQALVCECGRPECPSRAEQDTAERGAVGVVMNVMASEQTVYGEGEQPGYLEGYGVIEAEQVRALAAVAASLPAVFDPVQSAVEALRYQPSTALARAVRCRDLTCRFPGCHRRASHCDIDHTIPFNHANPAAGGGTVLANLKCLCRQHHRLKTFGGWRDVQLADGTVVWTSPSGRSYRTSPAGLDLFDPPLAPVCGTPSRPRARRVARRRARIANTRAHNRVQRPLNEAQRRLQQARAREIDVRKWRNRMRSMLVLFKGTTHSESPFATWINEPREPEELPPDWQPDLPAAEPLPDDPPF